VTSEPVAPINWFKWLGVRLDRTGLEAGPLHNGCTERCRRAGLPVELSGDAAREGGTVGDAGTTRAGWRN
jgi:hypothetical protein